MFRSLTIGQSTVLRKVRHINGQPAWLSALKLEKGDLLIVASNQKQQQPFEIYGKRWEIETLFQALKERGLNREDTRLTHYFRIKKMIVLLALGFCWAHKIGEWLSKRLSKSKHMDAMRTVFFDMDSTTWLISFTARLLLKY